MYVDSHVHLQPHGEAPPITRERIELYVERGRENGVEQIAFTEHLFRFREAFQLLGGWWEIDGENPTLISATEAYWRDHVSVSITDYVRVVEDAKNAGLPVLLGIELDWISGREADLRTLLRPYDWDIVLGSVHWIGAWGFDTGQPAGQAEWERRDKDGAFGNYSGLVGDLATAGLCDVLAHPDLPKLFGHRPTSWTPLHNEILRAARGGGCAVELNGNGRNKPCAEPYPSPTLLEQAQKAGLKITMASDAHRPEHTGWHFDELATYAQAAGYDTYVGFEARRPVAHALTSPSAK